MTELSFAGEPVTLSVERLDRKVVLVTETHGESMKLVLERRDGLQASYWVIENELQRKYGNPNAWKSRETAMPVIRDQAQRLVNEAFAQ